MAGDFAPTPDARPPEPAPSLHAFFADVRVLWLASFGSYCLGLDQLLPIHAVACLDSGLDLERLQARTGTRFLSVERPGLRRRNWLGRDVEAIFEERGVDLSALLTSSGKPWLVLSGIASPGVEQLCQGPGCSWIGPSARVTRSVGHKAWLDQALGRAELPRLTRRWLRLDDTSWPALRQTCGARCVVQTAHGNAGQGTRLLTCEADFVAASAALAGARVSLSRWLGDLSLNINAAVVAGQALVGFPSVQLVGEPALAAPWGGYGGNDYSAACGLGGALLQDVQEQTVRLGSQLAAHGFEGLYGLDFVVAQEDGRAYAVDLNPRWQGSTALACQAAVADGRLPLAVAVLACQAGRLEPADVLALRDSFRRPLQGAQLSLRVPAGPDRTLTRTARPGSYAFEPQACQLSDADRLAEVPSAAWLLQMGIPREGTVLEGGAWLARLSRRAAVAGSDGRLLSEACAVVHETYRLFGLEDAFGRAT